MIKNPFGNESETSNINTLSFENRVDRLKIDGFLDITRDKVGLLHAKELQMFLSLVIKKLESEELPDTIIKKNPVKVDSPF